MSVHFSQELDGLQKKLLAMAGNAEAAVSLSIRAFIDRDDELARRVRHDDSILDEFEKQIDEIGINLLARTTLASELRLITVAMKIAHDLERVGDEATTISRRVLELNHEPRLNTEGDIPNMAKLGLAMLKEALEAFVNRDTGKARGIIPRDKQIDILNKQLRRELGAQALSNHR